MHLGQAAAEGARRVSEDTTDGFARALVLVAPDGVEREVKGLFNNVFAPIDMNTGLAFSGSYATVVFAFAHLHGLSVPIPWGERDPTKRPWLVKLNGQAFKIAQTENDHEMGLLSCVLELHEGG